MLEEEKIKIAEQNKHIATSVIKKDIADTQVEIIDYKRKSKGYRLIGDRMSRFRADAYESGVRERQNFIEHLEAILEIRSKEITK